jgi:nucleotide-binding universal stress UspA family protein
MFKTIVLATDLSPAWDEIIACAGELHGLGCSRVILTHVISVTFMMGMEGRLTAEARPKLAAQQAQLEAQGFAVSIAIPTGLPAYSLNEVARCHGADLIVLGSHGQSLWREGVLGCFTALLRHVLFPTDFSATSSHALEYVQRLAPKGLGQVTLLHALEVPGEDAFPPGYRELAIGAARDLLAQWQHRLLTAGIPSVNDHFEAGHPLPAILQVAKSADISLIVLGTQGKGCIKEIFLGSVAHNVARLAPCPVLLIPPATRSGNAR